MSDQDNFRMDNAPDDMPAGAPASDDAATDLFFDTTAGNADGQAADGDANANGTGSAAADAEDTTPSDAADTAVPTASSAPGTGSVPPTGKKTVNAKVPKRCKKKKLRRPLWRIVRFLLILLLGILVGYASIAGAIYYAITALTIDDLQKVGIAEGADDVLTENGEVDLTALSILGLIQELNNIRSDINSYSLNTLMSRYGVVLPAETLEKLPPALLAIPLSEFTGDDAINTITENVSCGYLLSLLPDGALNQRMMDVIKDRPLSLLVGGKYDELLRGVKLGYLTGVSFDEYGNVMYQDASAPTSQECFAQLDLGNLIGAISKNEDIMKVLATDLGEQDVAPILTGFMSGALFEKMCEGNKVSDVLLPHPETGRYTFSLTALTENVYLGDALGYTLVSGVWYSAYTDDGDATNDTAVSAMQKKLADIRLSEVIGGTLSIDATFDGLYFGDLQNGYTKGDAIYTPDPEGGEPIITGYNWLKNGTPVGKIQNKLANLVVNDLINGGLDITATLGDLFIGDLQGYTLEADNRWYRTVAGESAVQYVGAVQNAIAGISLSDLLDGNLDIVATLGTLSLGEVQGYILKSDGWHRTVEGQTETQYVGAVQDAIADVQLSVILEGGFDISEVLSDLLLGDAMGYRRGAVITPADPANPESYDKYAFTKADTTPVGGEMLEIANLKLSDVLDGNADFEGALKNVPLGEILEYKQDASGVWYEVFVAENHPDNKPAKGVLAVLSDMSVNEINAESINKIEMGEVLGYTPVDKDEDGTRDGWLDEEKKPVTGMMATLAGLTVGELADDDVLLKSIRDIKLGDALGYTYIENEGWYSKYTDAEKVKLSGIMKSLADKPISEINESTIDNIYLGDALGYTPVYEGEEIVNWLDGTAPVEGANAKLAGLKISELKNQSAVLDRISELRLSTVLDYKYDAQKGWVSNVDAHVASGVLEYLFDSNSTIANVDAKVNDMPLGYAFGYHLVDDQWSTLTDSVVPPTGITAALVDIKLCDAAAELNEMPLGRLLGYTKEQNVWYKKYVANGSAENVKLTGITLAFADLTVEKLGDAKALSDAMQTVTLGEAMGYEKNKDGVWENDGQTVTGILGALANSPISSIENDIKKLPIGTMLGYTEVIENDVRVGWKNGNADVTGMMAVLADCKADEIEGKLNEMQIGKLLGFTKRTVTPSEGEPYDAWFDAEETEVTGLLATVANESVQNLPNKVNNLTVADVFDKPTGILAAIENPQNVPITDIGSAVLGLTVADLERGGVISGEVSDNVNLLFVELLGSNWKSEATLEMLLQALFGKPNP